MLLLAFDTSTPNITVAAYDVDAGTVVAEREVVAANQHGEHLAPMIADVLGGAGLTAADVDAVAVGLGPGPFTGLRVGIATGTAMADALAIPAYGVCSLDAIAHAHRATGRDLVVVTDARRKQVYWARYDADGRRVDGPDLAPPADLAPDPLFADALLCGAGVVIHGDALAGLDADTSSPYPRAADVAALAADRVMAGAESEALQPLYLRRPDARPPGPPKRVTA